MMSDTLYVVQHIPLFDKSLQLHLFRIHSIPLVHPVLKIIQVLNSGRIPYHQIKYLVPTWYGHNGMSSVKKLILSH